MDAEAWYLGLFLHFQTQQLGAGLDMELMTLQLRFIWDVNSSGQYHKAVLIVIALLFASVIPTGT